jgi:hypothetical protein
MQTELLLLLGLFACGAVAGLLAPRWTSPSGWAALAFPVVLPPLGIGLGCLFC